MRLLLFHAILAASVRAARADNAALAAIIPALCHSDSQPNPIETIYPKDTTGTINGTFAIVPIPYSVARALIPAQYGILRKAYEELIPGFPKDMYPAEYEGLLDHDVGLGPTIKIGDFQRSGLHLPFVDRLGDGYSSFRYSVSLLISPNLVALAGASLGGGVYPGTFKPACDAYANDGQGNTFLKGMGIDGKVDICGKFHAVMSQPYSFKLFVNITNQPIFSPVGDRCDNYISLYNTSVTQGKYAPVPVQGSVALRPPFYLEEANLEAWGYQMDLAFIERLNVPCDTLKGYAGTGPGDNAESLER